MNSSSLSILDNEEFETVFRYSPPDQTIYNITINWYLLDVVHVQDGGGRLLLVQDVLQLVLGGLLLLAHLVTSVNMTVL